MTYHDIAVHRRARIVVCEGGSSDPLGEFVRISGVDLRAIAHRSSVARALNPTHEILVDIDVMIDTSAAEARARLIAADHNPSRDTLVYVGTPAGLAGLITDLHALRICDGAVLRPLRPGVAELIREHVLSEVASLGQSELPHDVRSA